jgi:hypothetical protein
VADFSLKNILPVTDSVFSDGVYIILFNATSIPPHLLLSVNNKIYSITDSGRQLGSPLKKLAGFIQRKKIPAIFVEWKPENSQIPENSIHEIFSKYDRVVEGKISCLFPIRDVVVEIHGDEFQKANFIFELLPMMENKNALGKISEMNMGNAIVNGEFELLTYSSGDLKQSLQSAQTLPE